MGVFVTQQAAGFRDAGLAVAHIAGAISAGSGLLAGLMASRLKPMG